MKAQSTAALSAMGLSVSDAVRLFLNRIVTDQAFPFELKVPNSQTLAAMQEAEEIVRTGTHSELFD
ncbi:type II toxin-antitoxin system RelB/DinJ family antitoxin [Yersinia massiliensis]|uniref:type II toxin-antitoxin system RelB/DinJ family antitoxin n=1 Tax=Yersinia massiliensis TaxID=419257 RepID=UPI000685E7A3|nr:type II toxin-antitoxin system RelB/DinJ family antitoxin [Yersinia massiliensis]